MILEDDAEAKEVAAETAVASRNPRSGKRAARSASEAAPRATAAAKMPAS
jgi:hypothetical protein